MFKKEVPAGEIPAEAYPGVGIVVQGGIPRPRPPRGIAFVWGWEVRPAPSLPFGRWKAA